VVDYKIDYFLPKKYGLPDFKSGSPFFMCAQHGRNLIGESP